MKLRELTCGVYLGVLPHSEILHFSDILKETIYFLAFRKTTSIYDLELFNTFAGVYLHKEKSKWIRLREALRQNAQMNAGDFYPLWDFHPSFENASLPAAQRKPGVVSLAYLEIFESAVANHLTDFLRQHDDPKIAQGTPAQYPIP